MEDMEMKDVFVIRKDHLYLGVIALLVVALALSLAGVISLQGFVGTPQQGNAQVAPTAQQPPQQPAQPSQALGPVVDEVVDDDPSIGSANAPVIVVEFSDFQCPFCRRFWTESFTQLKQEYIDTGKVQFVYRDFPLSFHPMAQKTAEAAECANEQGKFLQFHNKVFEEQNNIGVGTVQFTVEDLKSWASSIEGLDMVAFDKCLNSGKYYSEVQSDFNAGVSLGVKGTPSFYIAKRGQRGILIVGAQPYAAFKQVIDRLLGE